MEQKLSFKNIFESISFLLYFIISSLIILGAFIFNPWIGLIALVTLLLAFGTYVDKQRTKDQTLE